MSGVKFFAGLALAVALSLALVPASMTSRASADEPLPDQMERAYIIGVQEELAAHGYRPGPTDGVLGAATKRAIRQYQKDAGLPVDGVVSKDLLDHLKFAQPKVNAKANSTGPSRELVSEAQRALAERGYYEGEIDGRLGPETREAVSRFQGDAGLPVTGVINKYLIGELSNADPTLRANDYKGN